MFKEAKEGKLLGIQIQILITLMGNFEDQHSSSSRAYGFGSPQHTKLITN